MSRARFVLRIVIILGCAVLGASVGAGFQALRITRMPQEFRSQAKLVAAYPASMRKAARDNGLHDNSDFEGTILETLESDIMKRHALERVRALHPELQESEVQIRATKTEGTSIFTVLAVGAEPRYTKIFLDALLDEFIAFRHGIRQQAQGKSVEVFLAAVVEAQKLMEDRLEVMEKARSKVESFPAVAERERLVSRLASLRNQRDDLRLELKQSTAGLGGTSGTMLKAKAQLMDQEVEAMEAATNAFEQAATELNIASGKYDQAKLGYESMFETGRDIQILFHNNGDQVAIQERASTAAEHVEDWQLPMAIGVGGGGLAGALVGFLISLALSGSPAVVSTTAAKGG